MSANTDNFPRSHGRCECGKMAFLSRKDARKALRACHPEGGMQVYHCHLHVEFHWHFGHPWTRGRGYERQQRLIDHLREGEAS